MGAKFDLAFAESYTDTCFVHCFCFYDILAVLAITLLIQIR